MIMIGSGGEVLGVHGVMGGPAMPPLPPMGGFMVPGLIDGSVVLGGVPTTRRRGRRHRKWSKHRGGGRKNRLKNGDVVSGYHQTSEAAKDGILKTGWNRGTDGLAGGGIYFARTPGETAKKAHNKGWIFK